MNGFRTKTNQHVTVGLTPENAIILDATTTLDDQEAVHIAWSLLDAVTIRGTPLPKSALEELRRALRAPDPVDITKHQTIKNSKKTEKQISLLDT